MAYNSTADPLGSDLGDEDEWDRAGSNGEEHDVQESAAHHDGGADRLHHHRHHHHHHHQSPKAVQVHSNIKPCVCHKHHSKIKSSFRGKMNKGLVVSRNIIRKEKKEPVVELIIYH